MNKEDIPEIIELLRGTFDEIINRLKIELQELLTEIEEILEDDT